MIKRILKLLTRLRIAMGSRAGRKVLSIVGCGERSEPHRSRDVRCANAYRFSLYAGVRCDVDDRKGIEQLCRDRACT